MLPRIFVLFFLAAFLFCTQIAHAQNPTPHPTRLPTPLPGGNMIPAWMTPPASGTTQADAGAVLYYYRCMACHGDKGQGLTIEWRAQWDVEHQNCAKSTCHGPRHPPEGFQFPKNFAPALVGANALTKYKNAQAVFDFVSTKMPFQAPGSLSRAEYWQLVAFLLRERGVQIARVDEENAPRVLLNPSTSTTEIFFGALGGGIVVCGILAGIVYWRLKKN